MVLTFDRPTKNYDDTFALHAKIFQYLEENNSKIVLKNTMISQHYNRSMDSETGKTKFHVFLEMPVSEFHDKNLSIPKELSDLLDIEDIISNPETALIVVEKRGDGFTKKVYNIISSIDKYEFNLMENIQIGHSNLSSAKEDFFSVEPFAFKEGIMFVFQIPPLSFFLEHTIYKLKDGINFFSFTDTHKLDEKLVSSYYGDETTTMVTLTSLFSLFSIMKERKQIHVSEKVLNQLWYQPLYNNNELLTMNDVIMETKLDLTSNNIGIFYLMSGSSPSSNIVHRNKINAADSMTYSKFIIDNKKEFAVFNAFDILPEEPQIESLKVKTVMAGARSIVFKTNIFFIENFDTNLSLDIYQKQKELDYALLKAKWDRIDNRLKKYNSSLFVPKLKLIIKFIVKYFMPSYDNGYGFTSNFFDNNLFGDATDSRKIPFALNFFKFILLRSVSDFFNFGEYENYFLNYYKFSGEVFVFINRNDRLEKYGRIDMPLINKLYFDSSNYTNLQKIHLCRTEFERRKIIVILEDSFTKQSWKTKVKQFISSQPHFKKNGIYIIKLADKMEVLKAKRIFKDRPDVYLYSEFVKKLNKLPKKQTRTENPPVRFLELDGMHNISKTRHWHSTSQYENLNEDNAIIVPYSHKEGLVKINGQSYIASNSTLTRLYFWNKNFQLLFNKKLILLNEINLKRLIKRADVTYIDKYLQHDILKEYTDLIINKKILIDRTSDEKLALNDVISFIQKEIFNADTYASSFYRADKALKEERALKILNMLPETYRDTFIDLMIAMLDVKKISASSVPSFYESNLLMFIPSSDSFDYQLIKDLFKDQESSINLEIIKDIQFKLQLARRNIYSSDFLGANDFTEKMDWLLKSQHHLNFNKKQLREVEDIILKDYQLQISEKFLRYFM